MIKLDCRPAMHLGPWGENAALARAFQPKSSDLATEVSVTPAVLAPDSISAPWGSLSSCGLGQACSCSPAAEPGFQEVERLCRGRRNTPKNSGVKLLGGLGLRLICYEPAELPLTMIPPFLLSSTSAKGNLLSQTRLFHDCQTLCSPGSDRVYQSQYPQRQDTI